VASLFAGVDVGGTNITCALGDEQGQIAAQTTIPTEGYRGPETVLERIAEVVRGLAEQASTPPEALGMGVPGLADLKAGITRFLPNLPTNWRDVPVRDLLTPQVGCPVYLLNDVRAATLAELTFGLGQSASTMAFFALGTGIGGGIVVDGKLHLGPLGAAGELGHQTIIPDGPRCGCGNRGCLETLIGAPAIVAEGVRLLKSGQAPRLNKVIAGDISNITPQKMAAAAEAGDKAVHDAVRKRVHMLPVDDIRIEPSLVGEKAGVLGGIALAMKAGLISE
jgi:glucokinase